MDDNSEDEFEENFGELDDEIVPDLESVHEELIENGNSEEQAAFMDPAEQSRTKYATNWSWCEAPMFFLHYRSRIQKGKKIV